MAGEEWVSYLYRQKGYRILERNFAVYDRKKLGEIDIICRKGRQLVVVEVKTRSTEEFMDTLEAVDAQKQEYLRRMLQLFLQARPEFEDFEVQIDVVAVLMDPVDNSVKSVKLVENAVEDSD